MIDLHTHTTCSDGRASVGELLDEAQRIGLSVLSITDHNTIEAYRLLKDPALRGRFSGAILSGVEFTTTYNGEVIEVLGYGFDPEIMSRLMEGRVYPFEEKQRREYVLIRDQYRKIGVRFDEEGVVYDPTKNSSRYGFQEEIARYPENERFFLDKEDMTSRKGFTRNEVYNPKSPLYVDESSLFLSLKDTVDIIHRAGGRAFLAHVYLYTPAIADSLIQMLDQYPLDGLECFYSAFTPEQRKDLVELCRRRGLYMSGGSDYHGPAKGEDNLMLEKQQKLRMDEQAVLRWVPAGGNI